ncbi:MAG TPA: DinB family protein [Candidatus Dormibacteraeota bacterium]|nr:DinB family protein [Candidatus Dormibacteraeota bacterium]
MARLAAGWRSVDSALMERMAQLEPQDFALRSDSHMPVWAILAHLAGARIYWLCGILEQPGVESTPFDGSGEGWEDHLDMPHSKEDVIGALESTWGVVETWLNGWTATRLEEEFQRTGLDGVTRRQNHHTVLVRLLTHEGYHAGELSLILMMHGKDGIDPWRRLQMEPVATSTPRTS